MDIEASNWSEIDGSNITAAPDGMPEGMAPSGVNDWGRAVMGAIKRWLNRSNPRLSAGTGAAYTLSYGVAPGALVDGMTHLVEFHAANGAGATLNVNLLGAIPLHYYAAGAWRAAPPGLITANQVLRVAYNSAAGSYRILGLTDRTGEMAPFAGATAPAGALLCFGQAVSRTDYVGLFTAIGTAHGAGDGSTTFNLPDLRGRSPFGLDNMGGASAGRLSSVLASTTLGAAGGQQTESAGVSVSVSGGVSVGVTVSGTLNGTASGVIGGGEWDADGQRNGGTMLGTGIVLSASVSGALGGSGSGSFSGGGSGATSAVSNVPPALVLNYLIRI
jgi:microcystin-dependent protein